MTLNKLTTALTTIFIISALVLIGKLLLLLLHRRRTLRHQPPISGDLQHPRHPPNSNLLHILCFKSHTRVDPSGAPTEYSDGPSPEDPVIDVFKLLETNGPSRFLCTIKEDDSECVESASFSGGGSGEVVTGKVSLRACLEAEAAEEKASKVNVVVEDATTTVVSPPCDSPVFFTPVGSPSRDGGV